MTTVPPAIIPAKRRVRRKRRSVAPSAGPAALQVIGVEGVNYDEPLLTFTLVFNTTAEDALVVTELDAENWSATYQGGAFSAYSAEVVAFDRISVTVQGSAGSGGADAVSYAADPADVSDAGGRTLAAFDGFPI
jgi:hypothetical protein